jgi:16S rRNA (uracil1498-N3)-methyltransferase
MKKNINTKHERTIARLFYVHPTEIKEDKVILRGREAYHAVKVLRLKQGDSTQIFDGLGHIYTVTVTKVSSPQNLTANILEKKEVPRSSHCAITLAQALPQRRKFDGIIEKATELGVANIIPLITQRTLCRITAANSKKVYQRWEKIIIEAAKQSHHYILPVLGTSSSFKDIVMTFQNYDMVIMPALEQSMYITQLREAMGKLPAKKLLLLIGPEGGFTQHEISTAIEYGAKAVSLGPTILKTDTATVCAVTHLQALCH